MKKYSCRIRMLFLLVMSGVAAASLAGCSPDESARSPEDAAVELIDVLDIETAYLKELVQILKGILDAAPELVTSVDIIADYMEQRIGWESIYDTFVQHYANAFTVQEMEDIIAFYQTPAGQKLIEASSRISDAIRQDVETRIYADLEYLELSIKEQQLEAMLQRLDQATPTERP